MKKISWIAATALGASTLLAPAVQAAELTLELSGIKAGKGDLRISLYDSAEAFLHQPSRQLTLPASAAAMQVKLGDLPPGQYALSLFQDLNSNKKLDTKLFGIPAEPHGFSNNATGNFGPPTFEAARFSITEAGRTAAVTLRD